MLAIKIKTVGCGELIPKMNVLTRTFLWAVVIIMTASIPIPYCTKQ